MRIRTPLGLTLAFAAASGLGSAAPPDAAPESTAVPLAPDGDGLPAGPPLGLDSASVLVPSEGPDGVPGTVDDTTLLLTGLGTLPPARATIATPYRSVARPLVRLAACRALACSAGADAAWNTDDDGLLLLAGLGTTNEVVAIGLPYQVDDVACAPERLCDDTAAVALPGADGLFGTIDDEVAVIAGLDVGVPAVTRLPAPYLAPGQRGAPSRLSPDLFAVSGTGPDGAAGTTDDEIHLFKDLGSGFTRRSVPVPGLVDGPAGRIERMTSSRALAVGAGDDGTLATADDVVFLMTDLGGYGDVSPLPVGFLSARAGGSPTRLSDDRAVVVSVGPDGEPGTGDDRVVGLTGLGEAPVVATLHTAALGDGAQCRPQRLGSRACALGAPGPDRLWNTSDDELVVVDGIGTHLRTTHVAVGGLADGVTSQPCALSADALLVCAGGAGGVLGEGDDDAIVLVTGLAGTGVGGVVTREEIRAAGDFAGCCVDAHRPRSLGGTRAALVASGADGALGEGGDDLVQVLDGVPAGLGLDVVRLRVRRRVHGGESVRVRARLQLPEPGYLEGLDLVVSLGACAQTIPCDSIRWRRNGDFRYRARRSDVGLVRRLRFRARTRVLELRGRAEDTGAGDSGEHRLRFTLEAAGRIAGEELVLEDAPNGYVHRNGKGPGR